MTAERSGGKSKSRMEIQEVATYRDLEGYLKGFRGGHIGLLVLLGRPGTGKTETTRAILGEEACWITGGATPLGMYGLLYRHRDKPVVLDDVDNLFRDVKSVSLLKVVCQTVPVKRVEWNSRQSVLDREKLPTSFETTSRVMIIANEIRKIDANVSAVADRGVVLRFEPDAREVHERVGTWFKDKQIYEWFGARLDEIECHSSRAYCKALSLKKSRIDWRTLPARPEKKPTRRELAFQLLADGSYASMGERARSFADRGGGSERTFYNWKKRIEDEASGE